MLSHITKFALLLVLALPLACSKKAKPDAEGGAAGAGGENTPGAIVQEALSFPAAGSDTGEIKGLSTVNFGLDSSVIDQKARDLLKGNAAWINSNSRVSVQIEGHCDNRGSVEYNLALGERRAKAVKDYLTSLGVDGKRLTIISYGKEKPLEVGDSEAAYAKNRRANFVPLTN